MNSIGDSQYLLSIRGLGYITVAGLLAELGPLTHYRNVGQLIKMAATNPTESESAGRRGSYTPMSKKRCPGLRWCIWTAAISLLRHDTDFASWAEEWLQRPAHAHPELLNPCFILALKPHGNHIKVFWSRVGLNLV